MSRREDVSFHLLREEESANHVWTTQTLMTDEGRAFYKLRVRPLVKRFEADVLLPAGGLQDQNRGQIERGMRQAPHANPPDDWIDILAYTIAGRVMVTLQRKHVMLSVVFDETSKESTAGVQGISGTEAEISKLVTDAIQQWRERSILVWDRGVKLGGIGG